MITIVFTSMSGNSCLATLEFGVNASCAVRVVWELPVTTQDQEEFDTGFPDIFAAIGFTACSYESKCFANREQSESAIRKYLAKQNIN
jgi:hypothetical protein